MDHSPGLCPSCQAIVSAGSRYCGSCGKKLALQAADPPATAAVRWYHTTWFVLLMLTPFALGPFALPLLWKSPRFSRLAKASLTLITLLWVGLFAVYIVRDVVPAVNRELRQLDILLQP